MKKGETHWLIADGYIPPFSKGDIISHECICVLNCNPVDANLTVTVYFEDREPIVFDSITVGGRRARHIRTSTMHGIREPIPAGTNYAMEIESNVPVLVQYSRQDSAQSENALMTSLAYPVTK